MTASQNQSADSKRQPPRVAIICGLANAYGRDVTMGATRYANLKRSWDLRIDTWNGQPLDHLPPCEGAIVAGVGSAEFEVTRARCKHVVHCTGEGDVSTCPDVSTDDVSVGELAAEHLIGCNFKNFAYYGWPETGAGFDRRRYQGFSGFVQKHGYECHVCPIPWPQWHMRLTHEHHPQLVHWLESLPKPTGILAVDDMYASDLASACLGAHIPVPEQIAIVGVNDDKLLCESAWPPLTSVDCGTQRIGYHAAKLLERMMAGETLPEDERWLRLPPIGIVERQSTSVTAVEDPIVAQALRFIREHACDPCTVTDVLRELPVARRWLEKQFKTYLGRTPHDEIIRVRMVTARRLLLEPDFTIPHVAQLCGFSCVQTFTKAFRDTVDITPAAYRRNRLNRKD